MEDIVTESVKESTDKINCSTLVHNGWAYDIVQQPLPIDVDEIAAAGCIKARGLWTCVNSIPQ
jgi:hypothetical protein